MVRQIDYKIYFSILDHSVNRKIEKKKNYFKRFLTELGRNDLPVDWCRCGCVERGFQHPLSMPAWVGLCDQSQSAALDFSLIRQGFYSYIPFLCHPGTFTCCRTGALKWCHMCFYMSLHVCFYVAPPLQLSMGLLE